MFIFACLLPGTISARRPDPRRSLTCPAPPRRLTREYRPGRLDRGLVELEAAIHAGGRAAGGEQELGVRELLLVVRQQLFAERIVHRLEEVEAAVDALEFVRRDVVQRVLVVVDAGEEAAVLLEARLVELLDEGLHARRNDRVEHAVDLAVADLVDGRRVLDLVERVVLLEHDLAAVGLDHLARVLVQQLRPDVVGGRHREALSCRRS